MIMLGERGLWRSICCWFEVLESYKLLNLVSSELQTRSGIPSSPRLKISDLIRKAQHEIALQDLRLQILDVGIADRTLNAVVLAQHIEDRKLEFTALVGEDLFGQSRIDQPVILVEVIGEAAESLVGSLGAKYNPFPKDEVDLAFGLLAEVLVVLNGEGAVLDVTQAASVGEGEIDLLTDIAAQGYAKPQRTRSGVIGYAVDHTRRAGIVTGKIKIEVRFDGFERQSIGHEGSKIPVAVEVDRCAELGTALE